MQVRVKVDVDDARRVLSASERDVRFATVRTLTSLAKRSERDLVATMTRRFDRPKPWTLRGTYTRPATMRALQSEVGMKDRVAGKSRQSPAQLLAHQFTGGRRTTKGLELWLQRAGLISSGEAVVPGGRARLDRYGNISRGQISQVMSQLRVGPDASAYASSSARSTRGRRRGGAYFWARGGGHLARGVWHRLPSGALNGPVLLVTRQPVYRRAIDLARIAEQAVGRFAQSEFDAALQAAVWATEMRAGGGR